MPCKFGDLSKAVDDLFSDDFKHAGTAHLKVKSKAKNGVEITVKGQKENASDKVTGELESKYTSSSGLTFTEKWQTSNVVEATLQAKNKIVKGTTWKASTTFSPDKGFQGQNQALSMNYSAGNVNVDTKLANFSKVTVGAVFSPATAYSVGVQTVYDTAKASSSWKIGAQWKGDDLSLASVVDNGKTVSCSLHHSPAKSVEGAVRFSYDTKAGTAPGFEIGGKYVIDCCSSVKAKANLDGMLNLAYTCDVRSGVTLGLMAAVNTKKLSSDGHKLGLSLGLESA
jgi:voltage-dependent anion channel protein 2